MRKSYVFFALVALVSLFFAGTVFAAVTGKIDGTVRDAQSGEPLPGANVVLEGTRRGATTDANGYYVILLVDPGTYTITASMVGYDAQRQTKFLVQSDHTSTLDFAIRETALALGELVVVAERPPVEPDKTTSKYILSAEDLDAVPIVRDMEHFIELQAGVSIDADGDEIIIRGGDTGDVAYVIDGVRMVTTDHGGTTNGQGSRTSGARDINKASIQELTVITGGYGAEYGNAQGGVVSVVTRSGGQAFHGMSDYQFIPAGKKHWGKEVYDSSTHAKKMKWDDVDWVAQTVVLPEEATQLGSLAGQAVPAHRRLDYTGNVGHRVEGNLSGPLTQDMTFFASGRWRRLASPFPAADATTPFNINTNGKLTFAASPNLKVKVGGLINQRDNTNRGPWNLQPFIVNNQGMGTETDALMYAGITHSLSPKTFYELQVAYSTSKREDDDLREAIAGSSIDAGGFKVYEDLPEYSRFEYKRIQVKGDLSSQVNRQHFVKTGFELYSYNNWFQEFYFTGLNSRRTRFFAKTMHSLDWLPGETNEGLTPLEIGVYASDKIEFEGMIVNAGVRLDYFFHRTALPSYVFFPSTMYMGLTQSRRAPQWDKWPTIKGVSPRLGVSHPITEKSIVRFFYGKFAQRPSFQDLFRFRHDSLAGLDADKNGNGVVDPKEKFNDFLDYAFSPNPFLEPKKTTQFEVGMDYNFVSNYVLALTSYYKSTEIYRTGHAQYNDAVTGSYEKGQSHSWFPARYQDTRGIELSLRKKFSNMFAFNMAYNIQWSERMTFGTARFDRFPDSLFLANGHFFILYDIDPATGEEIPVNLREHARREGFDDLDHYIKTAGAKHNDVYRSGQRSFVDWTRGKGESSYIWAPQYAWWAQGGFQAWEEGYVPNAVKNEHWNSNSADKEFWQLASAWPGHPGSGEANLLIRTDRRNSESRRPGDGDRRNFGSMTFLFATPTTFGPMGGSALGNVRANLVYRLYSGSRFIFTPAGGAEGFRYGPMHTRMDMNAEKVFGDPSNVNVTLAVEVYNLFNQRDTRDRRPPGQFQNISGSGFRSNSTPYDFKSSQYQLWGSTALRPTHSDIKTLGLEEGVLNDLTDFWDSPRELNFSMRIRF
jgi:hypothetical protein